MTTKLKIDLTQGLLEVEGSETFVKAIYSDFKLHFIGDDAGEALVTSARRRRKRAKPAPAPVEAEPPATTVSAPVSAPEAAGAVARPKEKSKPRSRKTKAPAKESTYSFLSDLVLSAEGDRVSLVEFMDNKFPITNEERNLVFLYYLQYLKKDKQLNVDHIFTCYKAAKIRVPLNLEASLRTTVEHRRWIKMTKTGKLSVSPAGKLYVEKQLPKKLKS